MSLWDNNDQTPDYDRASAAISFLGQLDKIATGRVKELTRSYSDFFSVIEKGGTKTMGKNVLDNVIRFQDSITNLSGALDEVNFKRLMDLSTQFGQGLQPSDQALTQFAEHVVGLHDNGIELESVLQDLATIFDTTQDQMMQWTTSSTQMYYSQRNNTDQAKKFAEALEKIKIKQWLQDTKAGVGILSQFKEGLGNVVSSGSNVAALLSGAVSGAAASQAGNMDAAARRMGQNLALNEKQIRDLSRIVTTNVIGRGLDPETIESFLKAGLRSGLKLSDTKNLKNLVDLLGDAKLSLNLSTESATNFFDVFGRKAGLTVTQTRNLGDSLNALSKVAGRELNKDAGVFFEEMVGQLDNAIMQMQRYGYSQEEIQKALPGLTQSLGAWSGALQKVGADGNFVVNMTDKLIRSSKALNAADTANFNAEAWQEVARMVTMTGGSLDDLQKALRSGDVASYMNQIVAGVEKLQASGGNLDKIAETLGFSSEELRDMVRAQKELGKFQSNYLESLKTGATKAQDLGEIWGQIWESIKGISAIAGGPLLRGLKEILIVVRDWMQNLYALLEPQSASPLYNIMEIVGTIGGLFAGWMIVAKVVGALKAVAGFVGLISGAVPGISAIFAGSGLLATGAGTLGTIATILTGPIGLAIAGLVAAGVLIWNYWDETKAVLQSCADWLGELWDDTKDWISAWNFDDTWKKFKAGGTSAWNWLKESGTSTWEILKKRGSSFWDWSKEQLQSAQSNLTKLPELASVWWPKIKDGASQAFEWTGEVGKNTMSLIWEGFGNGLTIYKSSINELFGLMSNVWSTIMNNLSSIADGATRLFKKGLLAILDLIPDFLMPENLAQYRNTLIEETTKANNVPVKPINQPTIPSQAETSVRSAAQIPMPPDSSPYLNRQTKLLEGIFELLKKADERAKEQPKQERKTVSAQTTQVDDAMKNLLQFGGNIA